MNLKFLKELNAQILKEDHEKAMSPEEMKSYLKLLHKKCSKKVKDEFHEYLEKQCDVEEADFDKCSEILCKDKDKCDKVIHYLENLSNKLDENSLGFLIKETDETQKVINLLKSNKIKIPLNKDQHPVPSYPEAWKEWLEGEADYGIDFDAVNWEKIHREFYS